MRETSKWGIFLPPPKVGLSKHLETPEAIIEYMNRVWDDNDSGYRHFIANHALLDLNRSWRIERSRADHLEEMVESLQREVADLRGKNGWFRRIFPRRAKKTEKYIS